MSAPRGRKKARWVAGWVVWVGAAPRLPTALRHRATAGRGYCKGSGAFGMQPPEKRTGQCALLVALHGQGGGITGFRQALGLHRTGSLFHLE